MNDRMVSSSKLEALQQQFAATDAARIQAEQDRDTAYTRIGEQGARIAELEAQAATDARTIADAQFALDAARRTIEGLEGDIVILAGTGKDTPRGVIDASAPDTSDASPIVAERGQGEGGSDLGAPRA